MKVCRVAEMRALDRRAIDDYGILDHLLMENAGEALFGVVMRTCGVAGKRFVVFSGGGNNGGDGFVVARKIHSNSGTVTVYVLGDPEKYKGAARLNYDILAGLPIEMKRIDSTEGLRAHLFHCDAIVDAIFGTGLTRDVGGLYGDIIALINDVRRAGRPVYSADIPSGIQGDTAKVMGIAVQADHTVTFGLPKVGNILYPGYERCGRLYVTHISFPPSMVDTHGIKMAINRPAPLPERDRQGHKGSFGKVLFVAGASAYLGAPYFAALSFMKGGGGYARLAAPKSLVPFIAQGAREVVFVPQKETSGGAISMENRDALLSLSETMDMVVIGPGLSLDQETQELVKVLVREIEKPIIVDGDGLTALDGDLNVLASRRGETVLTPHWAEMSRLSGLSMEKIGDDPIGVLQQVAGETRAVTVLKGARSLVGFADGTVFINLSGNPGMATAGSGDVLVGAIAAMFGQGISMGDAVKKGVFIHGLAGDLAALEKGEEGMTAQDILEALPFAVKMDREGLPEELEQRYRGAEVV